MDDTESTAYHIRRMDETAMRRDHAIRTHRELEATGEVEVDNDLEDFKKELALIDKDCEVR